MKLTNRGGIGGTHGMSAETALAGAIASRWAWFGGMLMGKLSVDRVNLIGFAVRVVESGRWVVIVRGFDVDAFQYVVAFGQGETLWDAMRNVTATISKDGWRKDKFNEVTV